MEISPYAASGYYYHPCAWRVWWERGRDCLPMWAYKYPLNVHYLELTMVADKSAFIEHIT